MAAVIASMAPLEKLYDLLQNVGMLMLPATW